MKFDDHTVNLLGEIVSSRVQETSAIEPKAVKVFSRMLEGNPPWDFRARIPGFERIELHLTAASAATGLATFWSAGVVGKRFPMTMSVLLSGQSAHEERIVQRLAQETVLKIIRDSNFFWPWTEPAFDLIGLRGPRSRPAIASVVLPQPIKSGAAGFDLQLVADMETCLAAAFFLNCLPSSLENSQ